MTEKSLDQKIEEVADLIEKSNQIVIFTGAGIIKSVLVNSSQCFFLISLLERNL